MERAVKTTIAIANQKGGVGKTTTAVNLAASLKAQGKRPLCIDFDPQCHLASYLGHTPEPDRKTITELLFAKATYQSVDGCITDLIRTSKDGIDFIPCSLRLSRADMTMAQSYCREYILRDVLAELPEGMYDYVIIDCNPSMGILMTNALVAADGVLIPVQTERFALEGLADMQELITIVKQRMNAKLEVVGLLPTMVMANNVSKAAMAELKAQYPQWLMSTAISRSVAAARSVEQQTPLTGSNHKLALQYMEVARQLIQRTEAGVRNE